MQPTQATRTRSDRGRVMVRGTGRMSFMEFGEPRRCIGVTADRQ